MKALEVKKRDINLILRILKKYRVLYMKYVPWAMEGRMEGR